MLRRTLFVSFLLAVLTQQYGCGVLAAGAAGAAIGHEAAEREHEDDD
jgi:hypothetical protein